MKKFLVPVIIIVALVLAGGYFLYKSHKKSLQAEMTPKVQPTTSNVLTSIKDALMNKALSIQCDFTDDKGVHTLAYIKSGAVRADVTNQQPPTTSSFIMKDQKMYFWTHGKTQGMMMAIPSIAPTQPTGTVQQNEPQNISTNIMDSLEKFRENCKPGVIQDTLFTPPSDVTFSDFSKMMPPQGAMPPVTGMPSINPSNYQQIMQQYGQPR